MGSRRGADDVRDLRLANSALELRSCPIGSTEYGWQEPSGRTAGDESLHQNEKGDTRGQEKGRQDRKRCFDRRGLSVGAKVHAWNGQCQRPCGKRGRS